MSQPDFVHYRAATSSRTFTRRRRGTHRYHVLDGKRKQSKQNGNQQLGRITSPDLCSPKGSSTGMNRFLRPSYAPGLMKISGSTSVCRVLIISKLRDAGRGLSGKMTMMDDDQQCTGVGRIVLTHYRWQNKRRSIQCIFPSRKRGAYRRNGG